VSCLEEVLSAPVGSLRSELELALVAAEARVEFALPASVVRRCTFVYVCFWLPSSCRRELRISEMALDFGTFRKQWEGTSALQFGIL
jgi:hypothetical protein